MGATFHTFCCVRVVGGGAEMFSFCLGRKCAQKLGHTWVRYSPSVLCRFLRRLCLSEPYPFFIFVNTSTPVICNLCQNLFIDLSSSFVGLPSSCSRNAGINIALLCQNGPLLRYVVVVLIVGKPSFIVGLYRHFCT